MKYTAVLHHTQELRALDSPQALGEGCPCSELLFIQNYVSNTAAGKYNDNLLLYSFLG